MILQCTKHCACWLSPKCCELVKYLLVFHVHFVRQKAQSISVYTHDFLHT